MPEPSTLSETAKSLEADDLDRPQIVITGREQVGLLREGRERFRDIAKDAAIFRTADRIIAVERDGGEAWMTPLNKHSVRGLLERCARWLKVSGQGALQPAAVPAFICVDILALPDTQLRFLREIKRIPTFVRSGHLLETPGYDTHSQLYLALDPDLEIPPIPRTPDRYDIEAARLLILEDLLGDFDFETEADRANAVALLITPAMREFFDGPSPLFDIEADRPGTGKTLFARILSIVTTGSDAGVMAMPPNDDQLGKKITAALTRGQGLLVFDNVSNIDSGALAALATAEVWNDRRLQTSDMLRLRNTGVWAITGNHIQMSTEIVRRCVRIFLSPSELGVERTYQYPELERWTQENRGRLIWAVLTLVSRWIAQGRPSGSVSLKSYVSWASVVGGVLELIGIEGFLQNRDRHQEEADFQAAAEREFFEQWYELLGAKPVFASDLLQLAEEVELECIVGKMRSRQRSTALGLYLQRIVTHPALAPSSWRVLSKVDRSANRTTYTVQQLGASSTRPNLLTAVSMGPGLREPDDRGPGEVPAVSRCNDYQTGTSGTSGTYIQSRFMRDSL